VKLRGRLTYHLSLHTRATVLRLWARAIENMPYIRVADMVGVGDLFSKVTSYLRGFFDEATANDLLNRKDVGKALTDGPVATELLAYEAVKALADIQTVLEVLERAAEYERSLDETVDQSDTAVRLAEKAIDDIINQYNETVTRSLNKGLLDTSVVVEAVGKSLTTPRADSPLVTDSARRTTGKGVTDTAQTNEALARITTKQATTDRVQSFNELVAKSITRPRSDSVGTTDTATRAWGYGRHFSEGGDYAVPGYFADNYVAKDLEPIDVFRFSAINKPRSDTAVTSDSASRVYTGLRAVSDTLLPVELRTQAISKPFSDSLTLTESIALSIAKPITEEARYAEDGYFADNYVSAGLVPADSISVTLNP
jgi:hypothetical protein